MPDDRPGTSPVFLDPSGRRRRVVRILAITVACAVPVLGLLLLAAVLGASGSPSALFVGPLPSIATAPSRPALPLVTDTGTATTRARLAPGTSPVVLPVSTRSTGAGTAPSTIVTTPPTGPPTSTPTPTTRSDPGKPTATTRFTPPGHNR